MDIGFSLDLFAIGLLAAAVGLLAATLLQAKNGAPKTLLKSEGPVFIFDGEQLLDGNSAARALLARSVTRGGDWQRLIAFLSQNFENISEKLANLGQLGAISEMAEIGNGRIMLMQAEMTSGLMRITLLDPDIADGPGVAVAIAHHALEKEVKELRQAISHAPLLIWRESLSGEVTWANNAYMMLLANSAARGRDLTWPLPRLFDRTAVATRGVKNRCCVVQDLAGNQSASWFDITVESEPTGILCFATPVDSVVSAETNLRDFMDTLAKTFAQLPIGLAIFDKDRVLQMFNPAMVELTSLAPDFLARKPSLLALLDAMRDRNLLPEPKDYKSWRRQIVEMERAAASGLFQENWALPDGQTFRVTGRPHPNGGLALMIEDISTETQRSRRYRSDLEINQSVIDHLDEAIVVFNQSGQLMWCNAAYSDLWGHDPAAGLGEETIRSITAQWKSLSAPTALWVEIDEFIHTIGIRQRWEKELRLLDGRALRCAVSPIAAGATMIAFAVASAARSGKAAPNTKAVGKAAAAAR